MQAYAQISQTRNSIRLPAAQEYCSESAWRIIKNDVINNGNEIFAIGSSNTMHAGGDNKL